MNEDTLSLKGFGMLLRVVAVVSSSVAAILSTWLPLVFGYSFSLISLMLLLILLTTGAFLIHGLLTHIFNDITDFESGTDAHSPALLSGGSRVIQTGTLSAGTLKRTGWLLTAVLLAAGSVLAVLGRYELTVLILVGIWGAFSYSGKPFMLSYKPFAGEWLSLFPSLFILGLAAPWIMLDSIPLWGFQNALVNALWCMAWVMIHHIPDIEADKKARPEKRTSVVFFASNFGISAARIPAVLYLVTATAVALWILFTRPAAGIVTLGIIIYSIYLILRMDVDDVTEVTAVEKKLLLSAMITALWLGIFA